MKLTTMRQKLGSTHRALHQTGLYGCRRHSKPPPTQASPLVTCSLTKQNKTEQIVHLLVLYDVYCLSF